MVADRTLQVTLNAKDNLSATFQKAGNSAKTMGQALDTVAAKGKGFDSLSQQVKQFEGELTAVGASLTAFGVAGVAALSMAASSSMKLESAMANVQSIARVSEGELAGLTDQVRSLAVELGSSPTDLADGLYDIVSSGVPAGEALQVLEASAISAKAGLTDTATSARAITAVLNAYGLEATEAGNISDLLFKTVDSGVLTFEALSNNLGNVLPVAAALGVEFDEVSAAMAEMTLQGISAAQAETGLAAAMRSAMNPTQELTDAVREYGYASVEALIQAEGLAGFLAVLDEAAGGSSSALLELLGTSEATTAVLALLANGVDGFTSRVGEMEAAATDGAYAFGVFQIQSETTAASLDRARAAVNELGITAGNVLSPVIGQAADTVSALATAVGLLPAPLQTAAVGVGALVSGTSLLAGSFLLLAPRIVETVRALRTLGPLLTTLRTSGAIGFTAMGGAAILATAAIAGMVTETRNMVQASEDLDEAWRNLKLSGLEDPAADLKEVRAEINALIDDLGEGNFDLLPFGTGGIEVPANVKAGISEVLTQAVTDSRVDYEEFFDWIGSEIARIGDDDDARIAFLDQLSDPDVLIDFRNEIDATTESIDQQNESLQSLAGTLSGGLAAGFQAIADADLFVDEEQRADLLKTTLTEVAEAAQQAEMEFIGAGLALAGWGDALSQLNMSTLRTDATGLAQDLTIGGAALDNTFRIVVGGTNAIDQSVQAVNDWATELIGVQGEWSELDHLLSDGFITLTQYNAAVEAQGDIQAWAGGIQENLYAVQAMQAPLLAELTKQQGLYVKELARMPAEQQLVALGWMDSATAAQAMEAQTLAAAAASGEFGAAGEDATRRFIEGAIAANPVLESLLTDIELVSRDHQGNLIIDFAGAEGARSEISLLTESIVGLVDLMDDDVLNGSFSLDIEANTDEATGNVIAFGDYLLDLDGTEATVTVSVATGGSAIGAAVGAQSWADLLDIPDEVTTTVIADGADALGVMGLVEMALLNLNGREATTYATSDGTEAINTFDVVSGYIANIDGSTASASVTADTAQADQVLRDVSALLSETDGSTANVSVLGDSGGAVGAVLESHGALDGISGRSVMTYQQGDNSGALGAIGAAGTALGNLNGDTATVYINAVNNAGSVIGSVAGSLFSLDGRTATTYVDTVYRSRGTGGGGGNRAHGGMVGIPEFAGGGMVPFWAGENGPEVAHFAGGGSALLPHEGMYAAPPMTYISPNNAVSNEYGGHTFNITVNGGNRDEIRAVFADEIIPMLTREMREVERGMGV